MQLRKLDLESVIDDSFLGRGQLMVVLLCAVIAMVDGFATQSIAFVAPEIASAWHIPATTFGLVFGAGLFGSLLGALGFGVVGDRFGRKPAVLMAVFVFAIISLATPWARTIPVLTVIRFLTGLGLGGALPGVIAITSEYAPSRLRTTVVSLMFCGFPFGAVVGGIISARLIPDFGWQSIFYVSGAFPLLFLPVIWLFLPESVRFLSLGQDRPAIERMLDRMGWLETWNGEFRKPLKAQRSPIISLFTEGRAFGTLMLWACLFLSLLLTYFLINWIPIIARQSGIGLTSAVLGVAALNFGAIVGCLLIGRLSDRFGRAPAIIGTAFSMGALAIAAIGASGQSGPLLVMVTFLAGILSVGAQMCTVVYCASFYPTGLRATGVGWAIGIGRVGSIVGPVLGGVLIAAGMPLGTLFLLVGAMSLGSGAAVFALGRRSAASFSAPLPSQAR